MNTKKTQHTERRRRWARARYRIFRMISVGVVDERVNQTYDIISTTALVANLLVSILATFDGMEAYGLVFDIVEEVTVGFFAIDYILRVMTAKYLYPKRLESRSVARYIFSVAGIIDLLSFLPYYLPIFFPTGAAAFRMFRVVRVLRLFRINAYYDSLNVITEILSSKKQQLMSSVFIIVVLMIASSLCMYSLEHDAQPEVFTNAFSGIWWSASTLLTVGYGDIYPVTTLGKFLSIVITFLGVGMVAIPTGIISAGFVEQYQRLKRIGDFGTEEDIGFIDVKLKKGDTWVGKKIMDVGLPHGAIIAALRRGHETIIPRGNITLRSGDGLIIAAEALKDDRPIHIKEITLAKTHPWNGTQIKDLDISRQAFIIMVKRGHTVLVPKGDLVLCAKDEVIMYEKRKDDPDEEVEIQ